MCESKVFIRLGSEEKLLMDEVAHLRVNGDELIITNIYGKRMVLKCTEILYIDFMRHKVVIKGGKAEVDD